MISTRLLTERLKVLPSFAQTTIDNLPIRHIKRRLTKRVYPR
jgi:hypothetical protein